MENRKEGKAAETGKKLSDFTDLRTWQAARKLRLELYRMTGGFPEEEKFGLTAQIRRAAVSVTANIAEGYGRFSYQENMQFCRQARASVYELRDHLITAADAGYMPTTKRKELDEMAIGLIRLLNGYIRSTKKLKEGAGARRERNT